MARAGLSPATAAVGRPGADCCSLIKRTLPLHDLLRPRHGNRLAATEGAAPLRALPCPSPPRPTCAFPFPPRWGLAPPRIDVLVDGRSAAEAQSSGSNHCPRTFRKSCIETAFTPRNNAAFAGATNDCARFNVTAHFHDACVNHPVPPRLIQHTLLLGTLILAGSSISCVAYSNSNDAADPLLDIKVSAAFTCVYERTPEASADADVLFHYARWLQKNNQLKQDKIVDAEIERLYRIAAENGHYKANINLQNGALLGHFKLRGEEHLRLSQKMIDAGVATGYYLIGVFHNQGLAGLQVDKDMALRYFRKAADQGGANAQAYVADKLAPISIAPEIAQQMRRCAAEQGNGEAAEALGNDLAVDGNYQKALEAFQLGVAAGNGSSASFLENGFRGPPPGDRLYYLGQQEDLERADRYRKIRRILGNYSYAAPKVPEINDILPLPPARLPPWDGKLQWLEARLANVAPPEPTDALINELARAKLLEPATGKPMSGTPAFIEASSPASICQSGRGPRAAFRYPRRSSQQGKPGRMEIAARATHSCLQEGQGTL